MIQTVNTISSRLSLRPPQRKSLEILDRLTQILPLRKDQNVQECLDIVKSEFSSVEDFERDFPSICFSLATGVGKTRLMGACIAYLYQTKGLRHFFVLAPNLTIYNKLVAEFREPQHPKYVFKGLSETSMPNIEVITGDDYDSGKNLFRHADEGIFINVFNISKINSEVRGGALPRIRRVSEYIGTSYFEYLASLDGLVLLMDESHRYRASAGVRAINDLKPVLGIELTATPKTASGPFKNVIYSYTLPDAMADGYVKEPAVVSRENFVAHGHSDEALERIKLDDAIRAHEDIKVELELYAKQNNKPLVRPFVLVVAQDTAHADSIEARIQSSDFYGGQYADKVITLHSNRSGEMNDEAVGRLLEIERAADDCTTEIVIHVNKLGEGWDVTNLYTIVPLRAFAADILTEQTLGRGLRLPYGRRTGNAKVDTLNIIAHDRFDELVKAAREDSFFLKPVMIGRDISTKRRTTTTAAPTFTPRLATSEEERHSTSSPVFNTEAECAFSEAVLKAAQSFENLPSTAALQAPDIQSQILERALHSQGLNLSDSTTELSDEDKVAVTERTLTTLAAAIIDIPKIIWQPSGNSTIEFQFFNLDLTDVHPQPLGSALVLETLVTRNRTTMPHGTDLSAAEDPEAELVKLLREKNDINYGQHASLLFHLAGQMVDHLHSYLSGEDNVKRVVEQNKVQLANEIHNQMQEHRSLSSSSHTPIVSKGFMILKPTTYGVLADETHHDFRKPVDDPQRIREMTFKGFTKCLYNIQKFDSSPELMMAVILENDTTVLKWLKPASGQFPIAATDTGYEPDFVAETFTAKVIIEPKRRDEMDSAAVKDKTQAAVRWCKVATQHELAHGGKPWRYVLIAHDDISGTLTVEGLLAKFERK